MIDENDSQFDTIMINNGAMGVGRYAISIPALIHAILNSEFFLAKNIYIYIYEPKKDYEHNILNTIPENISKLVHIFNFYPPHPTH